jgi:membrane protein
MTSADHEVSTEIDTTEVSTEFDTTSRGRVEAIQDWLRRRADTALGRLALQWFRGYMAASRNSGCAATIYSSLSVLPAALVAIAYFHPFQGNANVFAHRLVMHVKLTGSTAKLVEGTFGTASSNALAATVTVVITFLLWGIGIGQIFQDVYARAWRIKIGSVADQGLFALFFFLISGAIALAITSAAGLRNAGLAVLVPAWLVTSTVFWLVVPTMLLHRKIGLRALLPGALLASIVIGGAVATSPFFLAAPLNQNGKAFGSFGVVLTILGYVFILITMSLVCAVFSPVWMNWRESEKRRRQDSAGAAESRPLPEVASTGLGSGPNA